MPPVRVLQAAVLTGTVLATVVSGAVTGAASAAPSATTEPAGAVGAADPNAGFMDPPDVVPVGWDGLLTYGWLNYDVTQRFTVEVTGPGYELRQRIRIPEGTSVRRRVRVGPLTAAGDHRAVFRDRSGGTVFAHDFVVAAPVDLRVGPPSAATFWPVVRDGQRDTTTVPFTLDRPAQVTGRVLDAAGRTVREVDLGLREAGVEHRWVWDGRTRDAGPERGRYVLSLVAGADALASERGVEVRVASYRVPVRRTVARPGIGAVGRAPGGCRLRPAGGGALDVDCSGAPQEVQGARLTWRFSPGTGAGAIHPDLVGAGVAAGPRPGVSLSRRRVGDAVLVTLRVRAGTAYTVERVTCSYRVRLQR